MKRSVVLLGFIMALALYGCSGTSPEDLFDTARLEERQYNFDHAKELYERILAEHPQSDYAAQARERLAELSPDKADR
jgi:TolA-binding protein